MMTKMTKEQRDALIATTKTDLTARIAQRRERDAQLAEGARKRSDKYLAFFGGDRFATMVVDYSLNLDDIFSRCDKTLDRFRAVCDHLLRGDLTLRDERDQSRYTFDLARSVVGAHKVQAHLTKNDVLATATKRENVNEYVIVARRVMSDTTAERQSGIAMYTLELLGVVKRTRAESGSVVMTCDTKAQAFKRFTNLIAAQNATA